MKVQHQVTPKAGSARLSMIALVGLGAAALGAGPARSWSLSTSRTPIARPAPAERRPLAPGNSLGGPERLATIELLPDAVVSQGARNWVEYHAEITINRDDKVGVAWSADVVDDRGRIVAPHLSASSAAGKAADVVSTSALVANNLPDGFYTLRVRAALSAAKEPTDVIEASQHVEIRGGQWKELTESDWWKRSNAALAFSDAEFPGGSK